AFRSTKTALTVSLKSGDVATGRNRFFGRNVLVAVQIMGSIVLMMAAAQMYRNTTAVLKANPGFIMDHRLTLRLDADVAGYAPEQAQQFYRTLVDRAREVPGIKSVAVAGSLPFTTDGLVASVVPEGYEIPGGQSSVNVRGDVIDENYFRTFGVALL